MPGENNNGGTQLLLHLTNSSYPPWAGRDLVLPKEGGSESSETVSVWIFSLPVFFQVSGPLGNMILDLASGS